MLTLDDHPLLDPGSFISEFPSGIGSIPSPPWLLDLLRPEAAAPLRADDAIRAAVRDLLRQGGYKPTGRGKPSSEYLLRAAADQALGPINAAVDACNAVSLHSGLPISVIDADLARPPFRIGLAGAGQTYVFNASGQIIDVEGLLCVHDADGPCANAVKDSQRTKTRAGTRRTLSVVWGTRALPGRTAAAVDWYRAVLGRLGAATVPLIPPPSGPRP